MPNSWSKWVYVQGFGCKYILFKKHVNMFECMEIAESICGGVVKTSYKKLPGHMPTVMVAEGIIEDNPPCLRLSP